MRVRPPGLSLAAVAVLAVVLSLDAISVHQTAAQDAYTVVDLGSLDAPDDQFTACPSSYDGYAHAINDDGVVSGETAWGEKPSAAFRATNGKVKRLKSGKGGGAGTDINSTGQIAGHVTDERLGDLCGFDAVAAADHAAMWDGATLTLLPDDGAVRSYATAINDDGLIAGTTQTMMATDNGSTSVSRPVLWRDGELEELSIPAEFDGAVGAEPHDINASGQIVGSVYALDRSVLGSVLWEDGEATALPDGFAAAAINDDGVMAGTTDDGTEAAILVDGELQPLLGVPDTTTLLFITAINAGGEVVGFFLAETDAGEAALTSALWRDGELTDISTLLPTGTDWTGFSVNDIDADGAMLLNATFADSEPHAVVLMPES